MIGLVRSEWIKWRSLRSSWVLWIVVIGLGTVFSLLFALSYKDGSSSVTALRNAFDGFPDLMFVLFAVMGALIITGEYSQGTVAPTFLATPQRMRVLTAKVLLVVLLGIVTALVAGLASFAAGAITLAAKGVSYDLVADGILLQCVKSASYCALGVLFGFAVGALLRQSTMAVVICVLFPTLITGIAGTFLPSWAEKLLPTNAINGLITEGGSEAGAKPYGIGIGLAVYVAWIAVILIISAVVINRADTK